MNTHITRPAAGDYQSYFENYINLVSEGDYYQQLDKNTQDIRAYFEPLNDAELGYAYGPDKWTRKQVLQHIIDVERVMINRAFVASKLDNITNLTPMKDWQYVSNSNCENRTISDMLNELTVVRQLSSITFQSLNATQWDFKANNNGHPITARALAYIILGHALHHLDILIKVYHPHQS